MAKNFDVVFHKVKSVPIDSIEVWDEAEARKLDNQGIRELSESIKKEGLQNPPVCQKIGAKFKLIAGQRRLEAMKRIGAKTVPILVVQKPYELEDAKAVSIIENLHRKQMTHQEMGEACEFLAEQMGSKRKAAAALGISQPTFNAYRGFKGLPGKVQELVPDIIKKSDALRICKVISDADKAVDIAHRISKFSAPAKTRYLDALAQDPAAEHQVLRRMANHFKQKQNLRIKITPKQSQILAKVASQKQMEPDEMANQIISKWIDRQK